MRARQLTETNVPQKKMFRNDSSFFPCHRRHERRVRHPVGRGPPDASLVRRGQPSDPPPTLPGLRRRLQHRMDGLEPVAPGWNSSRPRWLEHRRRQSPSNKSRRI